MHNQFIKTNKETYAQASVKKPNDYPDTLIVTNNIYVSGGAKLQIRGHQFPDLLIPSLYVNGASQVDLLLQLLPNINLKFLDKFQVSHDSVLDFSYIPKKTRIEKIGDFAQKDDHNDTDGEMTLGKTYFSRSIEMEVDRIKVQSDIRDLDPTEEDLVAGTISLWANDIIVDEDTIIEGPKIVLYAKHSIEIAESSEINSLVENQCATERDGNRALYECMASDKHVEDLEYQEVIDHYNRQYDL